jgi:hypothetical protein
MVSGKNPAEVRKRGDDADRAMSAHAEVSDIVKEDDSGGACLVQGLAQERADDNVGAPRLVDHGGAEIIVVAAEALAALGKRAVAEVGPSLQNEARGFSGGVGVEDRDAADGGGGCHVERVILVSPEPVDDDVRQSARK